MPTTIPSDLAAEESLIGACLLKRENIEVGAEIIDESFFYKPAHGAIWSAIANLYEHGEPVDAVTVMSKLKTSGLDIEPSTLIGLQSNVPSLSAQYVVQYAKAIERAKMARDLMRQCQDTLGELVEGGDPYELNDNLMKFGLTLGQKEVEQQAMTISELAILGESAEQIIPGLLYRDHRGIVTAKSGAGKSTLLKMIGMCASQGTHPFQFHDMEPIRVLSVDTENPILNITQTMTKLQHTLCRKRPNEYQEDRFKVFRKPGGMNIRKRRDRMDLQREIVLHQPDLVVAGPVYKLARRESGEGYEQAAEGFIDVIDDLRIKYEFAVLLEAHVSKNTEDWTPQGSVELAQWSELGLALKPQGEFPYSSWELEDYRGERVQGLRWPKHLYPDEERLFVAGY